MAKIKQILKIKHIVLFVTIISITSCQEKVYKFQYVQKQEVALSDSVPLNPTIDSIILPYRKSMQKSLEKVLAYNPKLLSKKTGILETEVGNWLADLSVKVSEPIFEKRSGHKIDFCLLNHGGIRAEIPVGNVTVQTVFEVLPFENELVVVNISKEKMNELLTYLAKAKTAHPISGLRLTIDKAAHFKKVTVQGKKFEAFDSFWVLTNDYLLNGGDNMWFFQDPIEVVYIDYKIRNAVIDGLEKTDTIHTFLDNRFIFDSK